MLLSPNTEPVMVADFWNSTTFSPTTSGGGWTLGSVSAVPEIDPAGMGSVLALVTGALGLLERRRLKAA